MRIAALAAVALIAAPGAAFAQDCAREYTVSSGDTLSRIAVREFGDYRKWSAIYNSNIRAIGRNPNVIRVGTRLRLPCLEPVGGEPLVTEASAPTEQQVPVASDGTAPVAAVEETSAAAADEATETPADGAAEMAAVEEPEAGDPAEDVASDEPAEGAASDGAAEMAAVEEPEAGDPVETAESEEAAADAGATGNAVQVAALDPGIAASVVAPERPIVLLTADDYAPFTDRKLIDGGLITDLVANAIPEDERDIIWVNDWAAHLDPLLSKNFMDMGFPWLQPDCVGDAENFRCVNFHFSEPMFEMLVLLFTAKERPFEFTSDEDILGKRLCRPTGYYTHDLEKDGRRWLSENKITFVQPRSVEDCFRMLLDGEVDAAAFNEFTGRSAIKAMGIEDEIEIIADRPLSIEGLHVVVHKEHPRAEELLAEVNSGLERIKRAGTYQEVVDKHLAAFWEGF